MGAGRSAGAGVAGGARLAAGRPSRPGAGLAGVGLGLRWDFLREVEQGPQLDLAFLEVAPENYLRRGGYLPAALDAVAHRYPIVTHGLTLSIGAVDPPSEAYLDEVRALIARLRAPWHSDHLCFSSAGPVFLHDLLPLPHSWASVRRVAERARGLEERLGVPFALENISWYAHPGAEELAEHELLRRVVEESGCWLLLDVNNVYVNACNHGFDPRELIARLPLDRVIEVHVAGHLRSASGLLIDTHGEPICDPVYELLEWTLERTGPVPVLLERDNNVPPLSELLAEVRVLQGLYARATRRALLHRESVAQSAGALEPSRVGGRRASLR